MTRNRYDGLSFSEEDILSENYKKNLGGGPKQWELRGRFQVELLKHLGMQSNSRLADFGCGPLRAGQHIIKFLDEGQYDGYDFNDDFLRIGRELVTSTPELSKKNPQVFSSKDTDFLQTGYDYIIAFSVLNHFQNKEERKQFLHSLKTLTAGTRIYITHAKWMHTEEEFHGLDLEHRLMHQSDFPERLNIEKWGWNEGSNVFPLLEIKT